MNCVGVSIRLELKRLKFIMVKSIKQAIYNFPNIILFSSGLTFFISIYISVVLILRLANYITPPILKSK